MSELAPLIADLALILICAGVITLIFKKLGQPLVLGYIVAGFIASPHFAWTPSVIDSASIQIWADIGVIFLLFSLGLEFSIKKIMKVGGPAIIAALTIIFGMIFVGFMVGSSFGWKKMDAIFLGGMIAMSSTTIIYKAFDDLGLKKKRFASLVLSILILEDVLAVVLMVVLSTMAVSNSLEGSELIMSIGKLAFFLILWFTVGIFLIPLILRKIKGLMNEETLLVVALGLCFGMVVVAAKTGFSAAFGAFIMGSILAETVEAEHIDRLVKPVKDLFGAIFFVSVGMMVDPAMIVQYIGPIIAITLAVLIGQPLFSTVGVLLSGQSLKTALQCGFSLTQIGEFAFIIAGLGLSLGVTDDFLYPIVVAVSVITIFLTPYMMRLSGPAYSFMERHLPKKWTAFLDTYANDSAPTASKPSYWKDFLTAIVVSTVIYSILCITLTTLSLQFLRPMMTEWIGTRWGNVATAAITIAVLSPFLRAIMVKSGKTDVYKALWDESRSNHAPLVATRVLRFAIAMGFVFYILSKLLSLSAGLIFVVALLLGIVILLSRRLQRPSARMEQTFRDNLRSREIHAEYLGDKKPEFATKLLSKDMHLADFDIPADSPWAGHTLQELDFGKNFGVNVVSILRGNLRINIPKASDRIYPQDRIQVIGSDSDMEAFGKVLAEHPSSYDENFMEHEMQLSRVLVSGTSPLLGKSLKESGLRNRYHCILAGLEKSDGTLYSPDVNTPFEQGDILWVVGERSDLKQLN